jgi:hypothetical protein
MERLRRVAVPAPASPSRPRTLGAPAVAHRMAMTDNGEALMYVAVLDALTDTPRP